MQIEMSKQQAKIVKGLLDHTSGIIDGKIESGDLTFEQRGEIEHAKTGNKLMKELSCQIAKKLKLVDFDE